MSYSKDALVFCHHLILAGTASWQAHIIVATARSLEMHLQKRKIDPSGIKMVVVDEADHIMAGDKGSLKTAVLK
jgi:superfamily II DNA or RNA helicase